MYEEAWNSSDNKEYIESPGSFCLCVSHIGLNGPMGHICLNRYMGHIIGVNRPMGHI